MSITSGFIDISSCNAYFSSDTVVDDMVIRTGSNFQRIVLATLSTSNATMILSNNIVSFASNVGVGKSNPQYALDVNGIINANSLFVGGAPYIGSQWATSNNFVYLIGSNVGIGKSNPGYLLDVNGIINANSLFVGGAPYIGSQWSNVSNNVFITGSNVGIGTNSPQATLQVSGNMQVNGSTATSGFVLTRSAGILSNYAPVQVPCFSNSPSNVVIYTGGSNATDSIVFVTGSNQTEKARITGIGNIGIGTTVPVSLLHMTSNNSNMVMFTNTSNASGIIFGIENVVDTNGGFNALVWNTSNAAIRFGTSNFERMRINSNGFVGFGTSNPPYLLSVQGTDSSVNGPHITTYTNVDAFPISQILNWAHNNVNVAMDSYYNGTSWLSSTTTGNFLINKNSGLLSFQCASNVAAGSAITWSNVMSIQASTANIGIGTQSPSYPLHVTAGAATTSIFAAGDIIGLSDASVKTNLKKISNALDKVKTINGYTFERTDAVSSSKRHAGVLAQEVQGVLPEVVTETDGKLCVAYGNMIALLIEAVKDLNDKVDMMIYGRL